MNKRINTQNFVGRLIGKFGIVLMLLVIMLISTILIPNFLALNNLLGIFEQSSIYGIMALGAAIIIISGGIDLSAGSVLAFAAVVGAIFGQTLGARNKVLAGLPELGAYAPIIISILAGAFCGLVNGALISKARLLPFIATLGTFTIVRGFAQFIPSGNPVNNLISIYGVIGGKVFGVFPVPGLVFIITIIICSILLNHTKFGSNVYAIGGNVMAARVTGINIQRMQLIIYILAGALYGLAGLVFAGRVMSVTPGAGTGYEFTAISAAIIGGVSPMGGKGTIWGVVVGALILSVIQNALSLLGVDPYFQQIAQGLIIIVAVIFAVRRRKS